LHTELLIGIVIGIAVMVGIKILRRRPRQSPAHLIHVSVPVYPWTFAEVIGGLIKSAVLYAVYIGSTALYLATHPPMVVKWWEATMLIDMIVLAFLPMLCFSKGYKQYLKHKPKNSHKPTDYFVGIVLSVILLSGVSIHFLILMDAPGFSIWPSP